MYKVSHAVNLGVDVGLTETPVNREAARLKQRVTFRPRGHLGERREAVLLGFAWCSALVDQRVKRRQGGERCDYIIEGEGAP